MALARNRIEIGGALRTGEVWSCGWHYGAPDDGSFVIAQEDLDTWAEGAYDAAAARIAVSGLGNLVSTNGNISYAKAQFFTPVGLERQATFLGASQIGFGSALQVNQVAVVFSLNTGQPGASKRGRTYWPGIGASINSEGRLNAPTLPSVILGQFAALMEEIEDAAPSGVAELAVYSPTSSTLTRVSSIRCGNVPDTQRRRRDAFPEVYTSTVYPPP